jgi:hypothetical protein
MNLFTPSILFFFSTKFFGKILKDAEDYTMGKEWWWAFGGKEYK